MLIATQIRNRVFEAIVEGGEGGVHNGRTLHFTEDDFVHPEDRHIRDAGRRRLVPQTTVSTLLTQGVEIGRTLAGCCEIRAVTRVDVRVFLPIEHAHEGALETAEYTLWPRLAACALPGDLGPLVQRFVQSVTIPGPPDANVPVSIRAISFDVEYGFDPSRPFEVLR